MPLNFPTVPQIAQPQGGTVDGLTHYLRFLLRDIQQYLSELGLSLSSINLTNLGVSSFAQTLLDDADAAAFLTTLGIAADVYTPTLTNTTNIDSSTAFATNRYIQLGNLVIVSGNAAADATASGSALTVLGVSLPVASNLTAGSQCSGVGAITGSGTMNTVQITGDTTNDRATFTWRSTSTANDTITFVFSYKVA